MEKHSNRLYYRVQAPDLQMFELYRDTVSAGLWVLDKVLDSGAGKTTPHRGEKPGGARFVIGLPIVFRRHDLPVGVGLNVKRIGAARSCLEVRARSPKAPGAVCRATPEFKRSPPHLSRQVSDTIDDFVDMLQEALWRRCSFRVF
jgi:hypothetical protein